MPPPQINLGDLLKDIGRFADRADAEGKSLESAQDRDLFARLVQTLRDAHAKAQEIFPAAGQALKDIGEAGKAQAEQAKADISAAMQHLQEMEQARAAAPPKPAAPVPEAPPPIDPALGAKLRDDLLGHLFPDAAGKDTPPRPGKDIWQDWE